MIMADDYEPISIAARHTQNDPSKTEVLLRMVTPSRVGETHNFLNKDMKISNITRKDLGKIGSILSLTDIALQCHMEGAPMAAAFFCNIRDSFLCGSSSVGGFERKMEVTEITEIKGDKKREFSGIHSNRV
jgi:hypothetical protein